MKLSDKAITKFKKIYYETFAINLSDKEANERGLELLNFVKLIAIPLPKKYESK